MHDRTVQNTTSSLTSLLLHHLLLPSLFQVFQVSGHVNLLAGSWLTNAEKLHIQLWCCFIWIITGTQCENVSVSADQWTLSPAATRMLIMPCVIIATRFCYTYLSISLLECVTEIKTILQYMFLQVHKRHKQTGCSTAHSVAVLQ